MPENILIIKPSSLGDVVHALPVLAKLRGAFPGATISWLVGAQAAPLVESNPMLDRVFYFRRRVGGAFGTVGANLRLARRLAGESFDCVVDLQGLLRSALFAWATRAPQRVGLADAREGARLFYTETAEVSGGMHAVDRYLRVGALLGFIADEPRFVLEVPDAAKESAARVFTRGATALERPYIAFSPGARWPSKCWPAERFLESARLFLDRFGGTVFLVGTVNEAGAASETIERGLGESVGNLVGRTSLAELVAFMAKVDLLVTPDTGVMHIADALGTRLVAVFGPTDPVLTGPYFQREHVVRAPDACGKAPCFARTCSHMSCMRAVSAEEVFRRGAAILEERF